MCGFGVQDYKNFREISAKVRKYNMVHALDDLTKCAPFQIHTQGCIPKLQQYVESNLYTVGGIALGVALAQLLGEQEK